MKAIIVDQCRVGIGQTVSFRCVCGDHDRPYTKSVRGKLLSVFNTIDGTTYIDVSLYEIDRMKVAHCQIFCVSRIIKDSFQGE